MSPFWYEAFCASVFAWDVERIPSNDLYSLLRALFG